jgi:hypothetical protein
MWPVSKKPHTVSALVPPFLLAVGLVVGTVQSSAAAEHLVGGYSEVPTTNEQVIAAAQFAATTQSISTESGPEITIVEILSAQQQVVAGMNYRLRLKVKVDGTVREAGAVVWRKLDGKHELTSWTWKQPPEVMVIGRLEYAPPNNPLSRPIEMTNSYGFLVKWREKGPPEFFIYRQAPPSIRHFTKLDEFFSGLGEIPDGSRLDWVNTCCCPISSGMPKAVRTKLEELVKTHRFTLLTPGEGATLICTCESTNIVWGTETQKVTSRRVGGGE